MIAVVIVIGIAVAVIMTQEGGITSNAGEEYYRMASMAISQQDCDAYDELTEFKRANERAVNEYLKNDSTIQFRAALKVLDLNC